MKSHTTYLSTALVQQHGLKKGDVVALFAPNTIWYPIAMLAVSRVAGIVSGASPAYNAEEMTYALRTAKARFLMTVEGSLGVALAAADAAGIARANVFLLEGKVEGFRSVRELIEAGEGEERQVEAYRYGDSNSATAVFLAAGSWAHGSLGDVLTC